MSTLENRYFSQRVFVGSTVVSTCIWLCDNSEYTWVVLCRLLALDENVFQNQIETKVQFVVCVIPRKDDFSNYGLWIEIRSLE
jgi:hypothetical protein